MINTLGFIVVIVGRLAAGITLLGAGIAKIQNGRSRFLQSILGYDLVPKMLAIFMAHWLPYFEVLVGIMLIVGFFSQVFSIFAFLLFSIFSAAITLSLIRGMTNDCGCYRNISPVKWRLVYRDIFLMGLLLPVYIFKDGAFTIDNWLQFPTRLSPFASYYVMIILALGWGLILLGTLLVHTFINKKKAPVSEAT